MQPNQVNSPYSAISYPRDDSNDNLNECSMCLDNIHQDDQVITTCNHIFHKYCLEPWLEQSKTCAYCRGDLSSFNINQIEREHAAITCNLFQINPIFNFAKAVSRSIYDFFTDE